MGRPSCCDKTNVKKGLWTAEEDAKILAYVSSHGIGNWTLIPKKAGLNRCGKSCRLRWTNYLRPDLKHDSFTAEEEKLIIQYHEALGSRWSLIARHLPGRTDNDVKNYWNTKLKKKLIKMGIDPVTHKPVSQVLSEFGKICGSRSSVNPNGTFQKNLNSKWFPNPETSDSVLISPDSLNLEFCEVTSPCSFSASSADLSSKTQTQVATQESSAFCWREFLITDPAAPSGFHQKEKLAWQEMSCQGSNFSNVMQNKNDSEENGYKETQASSQQSNLIINHVDGVSSSSSSFLEAILDRDREIRSEFPQFLDESYDYLN